MCQMLSFWRHIDKCILIRYLSSISFHGGFTMRLQCMFILSNCLCLFVRNYKFLGSWKVFFSVFFLAFHTETKDTAFTTTSSYVAWRKRSREWSFKENIPIWPPLQKYLSFKHFFFHMLNTFVNISQYQ